MSESKFVIEQSSKIRVRQDVEILVAESERRNGKFLQCMTFSSRLQNQVRKFKPVKVIEICKPA